MLERHQAAVDSDRQYDSLKEAINEVASELHIWRVQAPFPEKELEQEVLLKIYNKMTAFCTKFCTVFPVYSTCCEDFRFGEFCKIEKGELEIHPLRNFHIYMREILLSLKPFFLGAKIITVIFQLPERRFLDEFREIKRGL